MGVNNPLKHELVVAAISTPRGGTYQILLPDGTRVWLNAETSLKFPTSFQGTADRRVELSSGEAYFEVSKDKQHPFVVVSNGQEVKVLGTHFNINSYDAEVKTTLFEGSVNVRQLLPKGGRGAGNGNLKEKGIVLKPGEQSLVYQNTLKVYAADVEAAQAWKNGNFLFRAESIESIMRKISYWYDMEVVYVEPKSREKFTGLVARNRKLSEILKLLELSGQVKFRIEGRRVYVTK